MASVEPVAVPTVDVHDAGPVRVLTISNEAKRNAVSGDMATRLDELLLEADAEPVVRCIVVTGTVRGGVPGPSRRPAGSFNRRRLGPPRRTVLRMSTGASP